MRNNYSKNTGDKLSKPLGTKDVMIAGVALVVAASTLVSDFNGYFALGWGFVIALILAGGVNLLLAMSAADLAVSIPRAGALYEYSRAIFTGARGIYIGIFLGLSFYIMYGFALSGEIAAGGYATQALFHSDWDVRVFIILLSICVVVPNAMGIKQAALFSAFLLIFMIGIRWIFGLAGFFGWGDLGAWSAANLMPQDGMPSLFGNSGILAAGLALAFWSFVGIEFACSLAEEVNDPERSMPKGLIGGIVLILFTSMLMGIGVVGTAPLVDWQTMAESEAACQEQLCTAGGWSINIWRHRACVDGDCFHRRHIGHGNHWSCGDVKNAVCDRTRRYVIRPPDIGFFWQAQP